MFAHAGENDGAGGGVLPRARSGGARNAHSADAGAYRYAEGRAQYAERFGAVDPVFANLRFNKGLDRFTLRSCAKVDGQWKLFCLVQNIEKLANHGYAT